MFFLNLLWPVHLCFSKSFNVEGLVIMSGFTIFFCGTGSNSSDYQNEYYHDGELVSTLASNMSTPEYSDWIIVDGPGSGNKREDEKWVKPARHWNITGQLFGKGWKNNVLHALAVLKKDGNYINSKVINTNVVNNLKIREESQPHTPSHVNLVGWSRGGVTCHMMANAMLKDPVLATIPVNIFAIDPVPGVFNFQKKRTTLGTNVRQYHAIYARDEHSTGFTPILPSILASGCRYSILPLPGRHGTVVGNASSTGQGEPGRRTDYPQPGKLVRHLVEQKLMEWGVTFKRYLNLTDDTMLKLYDDMLRYDSVFHEMGQNVYTLRNIFSKTRTVAEGGSLFNTSWNNVKFLRALKSDGIKEVVFVNNHHMNLCMNKGVFVPGDSGEFKTEYLMLYPEVFRRVGLLTDRS